MKKGRSRVEKASNEAMTIKRNIDRSGRTRSKKAKPGTFAKVWGRVKGLLMP